MKYPVVAALAALLAQAAFAQSGLQAQRSTVPYGSNYMPAQLIDQLAAQIDRYARSGIVTTAQARSLDAQLAQVRTLEQRYRRGGLNDRERTDLVKRTDAIREQLLVAENRGLAPAIAHALRDEPRFQDVRPRRNRLENTNSSRLDGGAPPPSRSRDYSYSNDDEEDMNDLRGPAPPKHDEGSGLD